MNAQVSQASAPPAPPLAVTLIYRPESYVERLDLGEVFPKSQPLEIELGSGDGSFLAKYAGLRPDHNFLGVERLMGRLRKLDRKGLRAGLTNLRLIRIEASYLVSYLVPKESALALHVYFPDPWPKRRHRKHRLINSEFCRMASTVLAPGGVIYLRTDDADYFAQMTGLFAAANNDFTATSTPESLAGLVTDFEGDFQSRSYSQPLPK